MKMDREHSMEEKLSMEEEHSNHKLLNAIGEIDDDLITGAFPDTKKRKAWVKWGSLAAMLFLCVCAGFFGAGLRNSGVLDTVIPDPGSLGIQNAANSIVILDVNPSIALTVNNQDKIVQAEGLNEDGNIILSGMDLADVDLTVAVNAIVGSMLQKGYLSDLQNAILVSVENNDAEKSAVLQERISAIIGNTLHDSNLEGTVLSQTLNDTASLEQTAQEYSISLGKAALIQEVMSQDATLTMEKLAPLSITDIALISQSKNISSETLTQNGTASDKAYISQDAAAEAAYVFAGISAGDVDAAKIELDSDDGIMVYEVEFRVGTIKYECDVDARTGQVVKYELEDKDAGKTEKQNGNSGSQQASATQRPSGTQQPAATQQPINGQQPTASQQPANTQQPTATQQPTNAQQPTATQQPASTQQPSVTQQPADSYIGKEAAMQAALNHAAIASDTLKYINAWLDYDDGRPAHYEVEFAVGSVEYEYKIDLYSGEVLAHSMEDHNSHNTTPPQSGNSQNTAPPQGSNQDTSSPGNGSSQDSNPPASLADIGMEAAKETALSSAGLTASQVTKLKAEYDYDHGVAVYEVEFKYNDFEYEYKIDAATGNILSQKPGNNGDASNAASDIGAETAKNTALSHAGLSTSQVSKLKAEYDYDHGVAVYEVEFKCNGYEYEYKIDAATGAILEYEIDD